MTSSCKTPCEYKQLIIEIMKEKEGKTIAIECAQKLELGIKMDCEICGDTRFLGDMQQEYGDLICDDCSRGEFIGKCVNCTENVYQDDEFCDGEGDLLCGNCFDVYTETKTKKKEAKANAKKRKRGEKDDVQGEKKKQKTE